MAPLIGEGSFDLNTQKQLNRQFQSVQARLKGVSDSVSAPVGYPTPFGLFPITGAAIDTITVPAPPAGLSDDQDMNYLGFIDLGGFAHVINFPANALQPQGGGAAKKTATFSGNKGALLELYSFNGVWYVWNQSGITFS
jgi:hypothetical protein